MVAKTSATNDLLRETMSKASKGKKASPLDKPLPDELAKSYSTSNTSSQASEVVQTSEMTESLMAKAKTTETKPESRTSDPRVPLSVTIRQSIKQQMQEEQKREQPYMTFSQYIDFVLAQHLEK
ncbi:hypothetical protein IGI37_003729 [Enterococcus sp. AZ194]|uniref:hypothetical protein n=1 Tax=Enterococcus sp. AZ194 TaxID=2774629 RepID=UPI003F1F4232